jgi:hypothetical protein
MKLKEYLKQINRRPYPWALEHGINGVTVWRVYNGKPCNGRIADMIRSASNGEVSLEELLYPDR